MAITLKRQLNDAEKKEILSRFGRVCYATGHGISDDQVLHFDHIRAFADGGPSELNNIAPMCDGHNKAKGTLSLYDFRTKLRLEDFFQQGDNLTLSHLLRYLRQEKDISSFGQPVNALVSADRVQIDSPEVSASYDLYTCPTTRWRYFYATLPVMILDSDDDEDQRIGLQPRYLIFDKVFELFRHFQRHPVLQPSVGRVYQGRVLLFDGQHKIAALLWTGRREFECKIYLDPDLRLLNQTNIAAHDKFAQTRFYSSIMVVKLGTEFGADFERYKNLEDGATKSESGFVRYLLDGPDQFTRGEVNKRFRSYLYNAVLQDPDNRAARLVSNSNRSTDEHPLTIDMLSHSVFAAFLFTEPTGEDMATDTYRRDKEVGNVVELMNMLDDLALADWNAKAGPSDSNQRRLTRMFRSKAIMAWSELLRDAICAKLDLHDAEDRAKPFYRDLSPDDVVRIKRVVERLVGWSQWNSPPNSDIDRVLADNKSEVKDWMRKHGLTTGYLMGASE